MQVLTATDRTQGDDPDDFQHAVPGDLVRFPLAVCDDEGCGCARGFPGMASARATTTAEVVDRPDLTPWDYWVLLADDLVDQIGPDVVEVADVVGLAAELVHLAQVAASLPAGTVIGHHGGVVAIRAHAPVWR